MYAVITRELAADSPYVAALELHGFRVVAMPVTRTERVEHVFVDRVHDAYDYVVATSARAVADVPVTSARIWAVGPATQAAFAARGWTAECPPGVIDGASLAAAMIKDDGWITACRVLVVRAQDGRPDVVDALRQVAALVDEVITYRTLPTPHDDPQLAAGAALMRGGKAAITVVFAPSQVAALSSLVGALGKLSTRFVAIGETTAAALRSAGVSHPLVAATPTPAGIASALAPVYPRTS